MEIREFKGNADIYIKTNMTYHADTERKERITRIDREIGFGSRLDLFEVNKYHKNGLEVHEISSTGIITVYNKISKRFVTSFVARPGQIRRYYESVSRAIPKGLLAIARMHQELGYNHI